MIRNEVGRPPVDLGWASSWYVILFPSMLLTLFNWTSGTASVSWMSVSWWWQFNWSFTCLIAPIVTTISIILSFSKIQNGVILMPAYRGCPGRWMAVKREVVGCHCVRAHQALILLMWQMKWIRTALWVMLCLPVRQTQRRRASSRLGRRSLCSARRSGSPTPSIHCPLSTGPTAATCGGRCSTRNRDRRFDEIRTCLSGMPDWMHECGRFSWIG